MCRPAAMLLAPLIVACSSSSLTVPRPAPTFSVQSVSPEVAQSLPRVTARGDVSSVVVAGVVVAPDPPCATTISADDALSGNTLTVRVITTVPGPGAGTCAVAQDGPNYSYIERSLDVPSGSVRVVVKYVVTGGQTGSNASNTGTVVLDQNVTVP
ncbi:MAG TPA: hypothetical protein VLI40_04630 [Gemmatimonadaceae bacterium]|nr:hypothetical protein [Gemmatimonadaceae bacterium]